jgi:hypothetical protein
VLSANGILLRPFAKLCRSYSPGPGVVRCIRRAVSTAWNRSMQASVARLPFRSALIDPPQTAQTLPILHLKHFRLCICKKCKLNLTQKAKTTWVYHADRMLLCCRDTPSRFNTQHFCIRKQLGIRRRWVVWEEGVGVLLFPFSLPPFPVLPGALQREIKSNLSCHLLVCKQNSGETDQWRCEKEAAFQPVGGGWPNPRQTCLACCDGSENCTFRGLFPHYFANFDLELLC